MPNRYSVDTHALVWHLEGNPRLSADAHTAIADPASVLFLPIIALVEAAWLVERGRTTIPGVADLLFQVDTEPRLTVVPLDRGSFDQATRLTALTDMHDRLIVAATLHLATLGDPVTLITQDRMIRDSGLVPTLW
jgi:PIN domain nuclease of toxin-antitoxin system